MTVKELKELINVLPDSIDEALVVLQQDPEGNGYYRVRGLDEDCIVKELNRFHLEVLSKSWTPDEAGVDAADWEQMKNNATLQTVVIFP